ncbi:type II secretion system protein N [Acinetobacter populi]|jgi:general secretion pathway protein N|uniref:Type II secretion system protein N n=1 Tax=Acinetobacter populi TaxID=1582270 RepID=A0A1Z9Z3D4_9GAMM|nr:type II secretion system protein N [Acinetobacter populi]MCH4248128.1 type II secretion system protein N [Acinetobacter populi]OUY08981.1 general secretion pathway protein [Acinetobacter populi]
MTNKKRIRFWAILFIALFAVFIVLQVPAVWLLKKFAPDLRMLQNVSGNIWQGQADWNINELQGTVHWSTRPWELLRLRAASHLTIHSGQTQLQGVVAYGVAKNIYLQNFNGKISPETLATLVAWQWPSTSMNVKDLSLNYKRKTGFQSGEGQLSWSGGMLNYPIGQRFERIDIPPLVGEVSVEKEKLKLLVRDSQKQRMADMSIGADGMLDVQITQRFLLHSPGYQGKAGLDTAVISTRQPLTSLRGK